jgi:hypothetical protein
MNKRPVLTAKQGVVNVGYVGGNGHGVGIFLNRRLPTKSQSFTVSPVNVRY